MKKSIRDIRHEELIDAAITAIYKNGYATVTMTEIAREIGATAASINYYFGSKENLSNNAALDGALKTGIDFEVEGSKNAHESALGHYKCEL